MISFVERFVSHIHTKNLFSKKDRLLLAVSGGADSVALCKLCALAGFEFGVAHCNFQLRGADADRDEAFVKALAGHFRKPFFSKKFDTKKYAAQQKVSTQVAARHLRYNWFQEVCAENGFQYILTAHHADDNIETLLMSFFRGTGIRGLTGIREKNKNIVRPLLFARRQELEDLLQFYSLSFVQDITNVEEEYTRNYFRLNILPLIERSFPQVKKNLLSNINRFGEAEILYRQSIAQHKKKLVTQQGNDLLIPVLLLQKMPAAKTVLFEILSEYHFTAAQLPDVMALLKSESGRYVSSETHRVLKNRNHLIVSAHQPQNASSIVLIEKEGDCEFESGTLRVKIIPHGDQDISDDADIALIDLGTIKFPLMLRQWKSGDYFYPLGMFKKKKIARFLTDRKLSVIDKEKVWVVESNKKIIWVVGQRIDERVKIRPSTKKMLRLHWIAKMQ